MLGFLPFFFFIFFSVTMTCEELQHPAYVRVHRCVYVGTCACAVKGIQSEWQRERERERDRKHRGEEKQKNVGEERTHKRRRGGGTRQ